MADSHDGEFPCRAGDMNSFVPFWEFACLYHQMAGDVHNGAAWGTHLAAEDNTIVWANSDVIIGSTGRVCNKEPHVASASSKVAGKPQNVLQVVFLGYCCIGIKQKPTVHMKSS